MISKFFLVNDTIISNDHDDITVAKYGCKAHCYSSYKLLVSESDDGLTDDNDSDGNEAGSEVEGTEEATEGNKHVQDDRIDRQDQSEPGSSGVSVSEITLPELLPEKDTKSDVWCHFDLRHEDGRPTENDKPVCRLL